MTRSKKIAATFAALLIGAPLALAATPTFAATMHDNDRHDGDRDNYRGGDRDNHRGDRDYRGVKHEKIVFGVHDKRFGHWGYAHGHRVWIVSFYAR